MKNFPKFLLLSALIFFLSAGSAFALGVNITTWDNRGYMGSGAGGEDQETEPGMINNQNWDLEGFFLDGTTLTVVGGFDFVNGYTYGNHTYHSGDLFIDVDGDAQFGDGQDLSVQNYGYDYALAMNYSASTYSVYQLSGTSNLVPVMETYNQPMSNPWLYGGGDSVLTGYENVHFNYGTLTAAEIAATGLTGGTHNYFSVDLGFLGSDPGYFISHFTIECGNDNLMGENPVPEPATMLLVGTGLIGLAGIGKRKFKKTT